MTEFQQNVFGIAANHPAADTLAPTQPAATACSAFPIFRPTVARPAPPPRPSTSKSPTLSRCSPPTTTEPWSVCLPWRLRAPSRSPACSPPASTLSPTTCPPRSMWAVSTHWHIAPPSGWQAGWRSPATRKRAGARAVRAYPTCGVKNAWGAARRFLERARGRRRMQEPCSVCAAKSGAAEPGAWRHAALSCWPSHAARCCPSCGSASRPNKAILEFSARFMTALPLKRARPRSPARVVRPPRGR